VIRYLSLEWIEALTAEVAASPEMQAAADGRQPGHAGRRRRAGGRGDDHLQVADRSRSSAPGRLSPRTSALSRTGRRGGVATGQLNAQEAFMAGRIRLTGDQQKLLDSQQVFRALDGIFTTVRARTEYR
jgi:hypothetical protein